MIRVSKERDRLASFPELNPNPIIVIEETGGTSYLNAVAEKLLNSTKTTGNGNQILDYIKVNARTFFDENFNPEPLKSTHGKWHGLTEITIQKGYIYEKQLFFLKIDYFSLLFVNNDYTKRLIL
ncbi:MAG: hypothetical protein WD607_05525 [Candidatus Paceibacterota bacterium]